MKSTKSELKDAQIDSKVKIIQDRGRSGIYFHKYLAIKFATWLDDDFGNWVWAMTDKILFYGTDNDRTKLVRELHQATAEYRIIEKSHREESKTYQTMLDMQKEIKDFTRRLKKMDDDCIIQGKLFD